MVVVFAASVSSAGICGRDSVRRPERKAGFFFFFFEMRLRAVPRQLGTISYHGKAIAGLGIVWVCCCHRCHRRIRGVTFSIWSSVVRECYTDVELCKKKRKLGTRRNKSVRLLLHSMSLPAAFSFFRPRKTKQPYNNNSTGLIARALMHVPWWSDSYRLGRGCLHNRTTRPCSLPSSAP